LGGDFRGNSVYFPVRMTLYKMVVFLILKSCTNVTQLVNIDYLDENITRMTPMAIMDKS